MTTDERQLTAALAGLPDRLDRLFLKAQDGERFVLSTESARNITEIVREWLRTRVLLQAQADGWQDIASAPKDGSYILLTNDIFVDVGRWSHGSFGGFSSDSDPTHWRPLPAPPSMIAEHGEVKP